MENRLKFSKFKKTLVLGLFILSGWPLDTIAESPLVYPFEEMVDYIVQNSPQSRTWNGRDFVSEPLFHGNIAPPLVQLVTPEGMKIAAAGQAAGVVALYDSDLTTMFLAEDIDPESVEGYSIILHELVHHMQFSMGLTEATKCPQTLEYDAYRIQLLYLKQHLNKVDEEFYKMIQFGSLIDGAQLICYADL